jgi:hypothetical protein
MMMTASGLYGIIVHVMRFASHTLPHLFSPPPPPCHGHQVLCAAAEYDELPVRHNEDKINATMAATARLPVDVRTADDPHTKANLLLQVRGKGVGSGEDQGSRIE